jgi:hypothetical protein
MRGRILRLAILASHSKGASRDLDHLHIRHGRRGFFSGTSFFGRGCWLRGRRWGWRHGGIGGQNGDGGRGRAFFAPSRSFCRPCSTATGGQRQHQNYQNNKKLPHRLSSSSFILRGFTTYSPQENDQPPGKCKRKYLSPAFRALWRINPAKAHNGRIGAEGISAPVSFFQPGLPGLIVAVRNLL